MTNECKNPRGRLTMARRSRGGVMVMAGSLLLAGCGSTVSSASATTPATSSTSAAPAKSATKVVVAEALQSLLYLPLYVGVDKGLFAKQGLAVSVINANGGAPAVADVISGTAQFSLQDPTIPILANLKGSNLRDIAAVVDGAPAWIVTRKNSGISSIQALNGKTVTTAIPPATSTYLCQRLFSQQHLQVQWNNVTVGTEIAPTIAGKSPASCVLGEPAYEQALSQGLVGIYSFPHVLKQGFAFSAIDTSLGIIQTHGAMVQAFVTGLNQALQLVQQNPKAAVQVAEKEFPSLSPSVVDAAVHRMITDNVYAKSASITPQSFSQALTLQEYIHNIKPGQVTYAQAVDSSFANAAQGTK